jgi:hypothetical protein
LLSASAGVSNSGDNEWLFINNCVAVILTYDVFIISFFSIILA